MTLPQQLSLCMLLSRKETHSPGMTLAKRCWMISNDLVLALYDSNAPTFLSMDMSGVGKPITRPLRSCRVGIRFRSYLDKIASVPICPTLVAPAGDDQRSLMNKV